MMHAITHLNPVMGVDVHIIQPPGPVPPVPIPHPYIGIVFDPADYIPIIGSTISIHGLPRAIAGTAGKPVPSHIPIGGTFIKPPGNEDEDFMGSATVAMDGDAATYMALPALSCQDVGMIAPPRANPKKKTKMKSMVLPTSVVMPIPAGPPVLIGGPPTISLMAIGMRFAMAGLGRGLRRLARSNLARRAGAAFRRVRQRLFRNMRPGFLKCRILRAEPVDVVTGEVVVDQQDFSIPGRIPMEWNRHYGSNSERMGVCGCGWETPADARLEFEYDGSVIFHDGTGAPFYFDSLPTDEPVTEPVDGGTLHRLDEHYAVRLKRGLTYYFPIPKEPTEEILVDYVMDLSRNLLRFGRNENGLKEIVESAGRRIEVTSRNGRIEKMQLRHPEHEKLHPLVRYEYDTNGNLITVCDALDVPYRFGYENHCLTQHTNRNGLSFYYEYDEYSSNGRCHHTWGDGGLYNYHFKYHDLEGRTEFTDSLGHQWAVNYNNRYQIVQEIDALGGVTHYEYDEVGRTTAIIGPLKHRTEYHDDACGNLARIVRPDGSEFVNIHDADNLLISTIDPNGKIWKFENQGGLLTRRTTPRGAEWIYEYNVRRDLTCTVNPLGSRTNFRWDQYGNLVAVTDPLGYSINFGCNMQGSILLFVDSLGQETSYQYDPKERLISVSYPSGKVVQLAYDNEDNLTHCRDQNGNLTRFEYTGIGEVSRRIKPDGTTVRYEYDTEERLTAVINERSQRYELVRDPLGRIIREIDYWGYSKEYKYDGAGNVVEIKDPLTRITQITYDTLGRMVEKTYFDGKKEKFNYDLNGNLILAENETISVVREYDDDGHVVLEQQGDFKVENIFDPLGRRIKRISGHGNYFELTYDSVSNVIGLSLNGRKHVVSQYDALGRVIQEVLGQQLKRVMVYNADGRLRHQKLECPTEMIERLYEYDSVGNLTKRLDPKKRENRLRYSLAGQVLEHFDPLGNLQQFHYDPSGELLREIPGYEKTSPNTVRAAAYNGVIYEYDAAGNVVLRRTQTSKTIFNWDGGNRLVRAVSENGQSVEFGYDALGRRIYKSRDGEIVRFHWDRNTLLSDHSNLKEKAREFFFREGTFKPVVFATDFVGYFENDQIGVPHEVVDVKGRRLWSGIYDAWGAVEKVLVDEVDNPLRLQGQYFDNETQLAYNRNRYYDPKIGSFISQDPIGLVGGSNLYRPFPNVWAWIDPFGLTCSISFDYAQDLARLLYQRSRWMREIQRIARIRDMARQYRAIDDFITNYRRATGIDIDVIPRHQAGQHGLGPGNWGTYRPDEGRILMHEDVFTNPRVNPVDEIGHEVGAAELGRTLGIPKESIPAVHGMPGGGEGYLTHVADMHY
ncbi:MAG: RHS domain-containing protein [Desulfobacterales bacterium]|nr:MAG: RHS domain-containing protein [Desulfobacterales bacterium]